MNLPTGPQVAPVGPGGPGRELDPSGPQVKFAPTPKPGNGGVFDSASDAIRNGDPASHVRNIASFQKSSAPDHKITAGRAA